MARYSGKVKHTELAIFNFIPIFPQPSVLIDLSSDLYKNKTEKFNYFDPGRVMSGDGLLSFELADSKQSTQYQWRQISVIESVVSAGIGRSRLISTDSDGKVEETKLANFFSITGINFSNVRDNDQAITDKITELTDQVWEYNDVTSGVYADP